MSIEELKTGGFLVKSKGDRCKDAKNEQMSAENKCNSKKDELLNMVLGGFSYPFMIPGSSQRCSHPFEGCIVLEKETEVSSSHWLFRQDTQKLIPESFP